jgi:hypothetical protein
MAEAQGGGSVAQDVHSIYGVPAFALDDHQVVDEDAVAWLRLSRMGWTPVSSLEEAKALMEGFLEVWVDQSGRGYGDLPGGFGVLAGPAGDLLAWIAPNGLVRGLRAIPGAQWPIRFSHLSLEKDERDEGEAYQPCEADAWAMGRPVMV